MSSHNDKNLSGVIAAYLEAVDSGEKPDPEEWIGRHPEIADQLRSFFSAQQQMQQLAEPLREVDSNAETMDHARSETEELPETVRYFGDYEIEREIARGGMGIVYRARQKSLNRSVALKMIRAGLFADETEVRRFRDEAEAAANLDHPHIVPIYEVGEHEGRHYFSMKLIEGGSLSMHLPRYRHDPKAIAQLMITIAQAVHHAHQRGILHRDLKPENVLIDREGQPHVTDFGLAKRLESDEGVTESGARVGTLHFMSPEQARGEKSLTTAVDVYGMGAILYVLLTGAPPFPADNVLDALKLITESEPTSPRSLSPSTDRDLEVICLKCLQKDPEKRYSTAAAFANDLKRWLIGEPITARSAGWAERTGKWIRRHPAKASLISLCVSGVLLVLGIVAYYNSRLRQQVHLTEKKNDELQIARQREVEALITQFIAPLGRSGENLTVVEMETLVGLARIENDAIGLGVIRRGLDHPEVAEQLVRRMDMVAVATVGLDRKKLQIASQWILETMNQQKIHLHQKRFAVHLGVALEIEEQTFNVQAAQFLTEQTRLRQEKHSNEDHDLQRARTLALIEVCRRLRSANAARIIRVGLEQTKQSTAGDAVFGEIGGRFYGQETPFSILYQKLDATDANVIAHSVLGYLETIDPGQAAGHLYHLEKLRTRLNPDDEKRFLKWNGKIRIAAQARRANKSQHLIYQIEPKAFVDFCHQTLNPKQAEQIMNKLLPKIAEAQTKAEIQKPLQILEEVCRQLKPGDHPLKRRVADVLARTNCRLAPPSKQGLEILHRILALNQLNVAPSAEDVQTLLQLAQQQWPSQDVELDYFFPSELDPRIGIRSGAIHWLAAHLSKAEAEKFFVPVAAYLLRRTESKEGKQSIDQNWVSTAANASQHLPEPDASRFKTKIADVLLGLYQSQLNAKQKGGEKLYLPQPSWPGGGQLGRANPQQSRDAQQIFQMILKDITKPESLRTHAMRWDRAERLSRLADFLHAWSSFLDKSVLENLTAHLRKALSETTEGYPIYVDPFEHGFVGAANGLLRLAVWMPVDQIASGTTYSLSIKRIQGEMYPSEVNRWCRPIWKRLSQEELTNVLKHPVCTGVVQQSVLEELGQRTNQRFETIWDFVKWAEQHKSKLRLASPLHKEDAGAF